MEDNKKVYYALVACGVVLVLAVCWYLLAEPNISDQRERASDVGESLDRAGSEQRNVENHLERIERGLDDSLGRADEIAERISDAENAITASQERRGECEKLIGDSESRIAESRAILQAVRARKGQDRK